MPASPQRIPIALIGMITLQQQLPLLCAFRQLSHTRVIHIRHAMQKQAGTPGAYHPEWFAGSPTTGYAQRHDRPDWEMSRAASRISAIPRQSNQSRLLRTAVAATK